MLKMEELRSVNFNFISKVTETKKLLEWHVEFSIEDELNFMDSNAQVSLLKE